MRSTSTPFSSSASARRTPWRSTRLRTLSGTRLPLAPDDHSRLREKRAPSSSAKSTTASVTGGVLPAYRRNASTPARTPSGPSSQPPLGTESRWPPMTTVSGRAPASEIHRLPAASAFACRPSAASRSSSQRRASRHTGPHATRCAPLASLVRDARARRLAITSRALTRTFDLRAARQGAPRPRRTRVLGVASRSSLAGQPECDELAAVIAAADRHDEVLPAIQHVRHRRPGLRGGHVDCAHFFPRRLVVGSQYGAAPAVGECKEAALARHDQALRRQRSDAPWTPRTRNVHAFERRVITNVVGRLAMRNLPHDLAPVEVDGGNARVRRLDDRQPLHRHRAAAFISTAAALAGRFG